MISDQSSVMNTPTTRCEVIVNEREHVLCALNHRTPDRVPLDLGSTGTTGMHVSCVAALRGYYGLEKHPVKVHEPHQMLGWVDDDLKDALGVDVSGPLPHGTNYGYLNENWKSWVMPDGLEVLVGSGFNTTIDGNGDILLYPQGDTSVSPSGRMPKDGYFFDAIIRQPPIVEDELDPEDNLEEFGELSESALKRLVESILLAADGKRAVIAKLPDMGFGDIARVPAVHLKHPKGIRDVAEWYMATASRQDYVHAVFSKQCDYAMTNLKRIHDAVGNVIDVAYICGTDFGTQRSSFCSLETFNSLYAPYYKRINTWIHENTAWKPFKHSCGAVAKFLDAFIECGFEVFNPVQCSAKGMEPEVLKERFGDRIVFWGGGVDTQRTLPFGTPQEVRDEVLKRCEIFSRGGGFVFNPVHNIQARTPVENIVAMAEALREFNGER